MHTYRLLQAYLVQYLLRKPSLLYSVTSKSYKVVLLLSLVFPCCFSEILSKRLSERLSERLAETLSEILSEILSETPFEILSEILSHMQAAYLLAEMAEHPCTHQLIIQHGSLAAILRTMHATCRACTTARTLDSVAARQLPHPTQLSEAVTCDASAFKGDSSSLDEFRPVDQGQIAVSDFAWDFGRVRTTPDQHTGRKATEEGSHDVQAEPEHPLEHLGKEHSSSAAEIADSASASGSALFSDVSRTDAGDFASSGAQSGDQASGAFGLRGVASNTADAASTAVPSSMANIGSGSSSSSSSSSSSVVGGDGVSFGGVAASSIHSRLLQAAQAAAHTEAACSSSGRTADMSTGLSTCSPHDGLLTIAQPLQNFCKAGHQLGYPF
jgi:hypothetical protein